MLLAATVEEPTWLEKLFGVPIPDYVIWIALGVIVLVVIAFILKGFFSELKKK
ncbi:MAG: hypothetical protein LBU48_07600 [Coriobacteriales bacterium]|jgi:uncharacterized membrane protein|nr:hypothetical protein [Coriobacteriales bacterium]